MSGQRGTCRRFVTEIKSEEFVMRAAYIDLTGADIEKKDLDDSIAKAFIGGFGVNLRLACDLIRPGVPPLSPENVIIAGVGPLVGTRVQAPRWTIVTKLPLGGSIGLNGGGAGFGVRLQYAGWDQLVISGRAPKPVYLKICDDDIEICDAGELWGKDIFETTEALWQKYGKAYSVVAIGQAGENLVTSSIALVDKLSALGKGGLAAVMGSKNLKAMVVAGTNKQTKIADRERFDRACDELLSQMKATPELKKWVELGKISAVSPLIVPCKNYTEVYPDEKYQELYGIDAYLARVKGRRTGCLTCAYPCKDALEVKQGALKGLTTNISSLPGRIWLLGIHCSGGCSFEDVVKLTDMAQRYGIDTQVFAPTVEVVIELYERGIITAEDVGYVIPKRDFTTTLLLLEMTAFKRGIGQVLGDGSPGVIERFGKECEKYSTHNKGIDQVVEPRANSFNTHCFAQVVSPCGRHMGGEMGHSLQPGIEGYSLDKVRKLCERVGCSRQAIDRIFDVSAGFNVGRLTRYTEDFFMVLSSLGICDYRNEFYNWENLAELYSSATGIEMTADEIKECGERISNLWKALNVREGFDRKDDRFPERWLEPLRTSDGGELPLTGCGGETITLDLLNQMLDDYYDERGWDIRTGVPGKDKLAELGLEALLLVT
jgi:aldehyde:ferredoxin oxidoreductase